MGTVNGGTIISFTPNPPSLHAVSSRMPSHHPTGCANFTFQIPSIANAAKKNTNSAERRANHNAVERARRECLNTKFQELAHALPSLAQVRRPSKSIIVQKSLDFIYTSRQKDDLHDKEMRSILSENESLREEVNRLREQLGLEPLPPREESKPISQQIDEVKEDANTNTKSNTPEIKIEADNNPTTTNAQESANSSAIHIKSEDSRSDDDCSNGNTDDDYDLDQMDGKNTEDNQLIENQQCLYDCNSLIYSQLVEPMNHHTDYSQPGYGFPMDMTSIDNIYFDDHQLVANDINSFCNPFQQKFYPSPPYEGTTPTATMIDLTGQISGFPMNTENSHVDFHS
ncbi:acetylglutamate kinase/n-acetyl-gamma-glutamyl-phosphate reductase [Gigaspora margarita]|uniref:Acetylglutamate kinase/n-acetyl-gamma-glutamyl-phosphate reductase n=1 Tax=Gigaspora margarita TaxID=4874 RepID=A0A8H3X6B2_GIGMA|nr:acetylglutamate kinase/n-acetyl-gamma-glutamyl-phosphate reductase [Gigaspora margarita]